MTPEQLKESILWSAIQGKITEQNPNEYAYSNNAFSLVPEDEIYFEIPDNWNRVLIKDIFELVNGKAFKPTDWGTTGLPIVRIQNLNDSQAPYNYFSGEIDDKFLLHGGELLFSWSGTPGTSFGAYEWNGGNAVLNQHIFILHSKFEYNKQYIKYALNGELKIFIEKAHGGVGLKHITKKEFENCSLPLPPLEEQYRIVAKIEELLPYVDRYAEAYEKLEQFNAKFPEDMKKSILQYAIQGKLVEQRPEEGTAEELYQEIQDEKQKLIKEGKIKKEKPLAEITEDEIPFDIPENWKWCYLQDIAVLNSGNQYEELSSGLPYIKVADMNLEGNKEEITTSTRYASQENKGVISVNSIIFPKRGGAIATNKKRLVKKTEIFIDSNTMAMTLLHEGLLPYIKFWFDGVDLGKLQSGSSVPQINNKDIYPLLVPLPPLEEQHRIVSKIEELLPYCDQLSNKH